MHDAAVSSRCCAGLVQVIVDAHHDVQRAGLDRRRDDDLFHAGGEVRVQRLGRSKLPAAFEDDVHAPGRPRNVARLRDRRESDCVPIDLNLSRLPLRPVGATGRVLSRTSAGEPPFGATSHFVDMDEFQIGPPHPARSASRPIRPNPLIPIFIAIK